MRINNLESASQLKCYSQLYEYQSIMIVNQYPTLLINSGKLPRIFLTRNTESECAPLETS